MSSLLNAVIVLLDSSVGWQLSRVAFEASVASQLRSQAVGLKSRSLKRTGQYAKELPELVARKTFLIRLRSPEKLWVVLGSFCK